MAILAEYIDLEEVSVRWSSRLWHLLNTQNVPSSILGRIIFSFHIHSGLVMEYVVEILVFGSVGCDILVSFMT